MQVSKRIEKTSLRQRITFGLLAASAVALLALALFAHIKDSSVSCDFITFYTAGTLLKQGLGSQLYDESAQLTFQRRFFGPKVISEVYIHPPFEALLYWPLAYLPYATAYLLWDLLNLVTLGWSLYLLKPYAVNLDTSSRLVITLAVLLPLISTLREGQNEILLLLACVGTFLCLKKRREIAAGGALAAGLFRFPFVLPLFLVFLVLRRWRVIVGAAAVSVILGLLSLALAGWVGILDYIKVLLTLSKSGAFPIGVPAMPTVRGFAEVCLGGKVRPPYLTALVVVCSLALLAWPVVKWHRRQWNPDDRAFNLLISLSVVVCLLISYHSLFYSLVVLCLPAVLLLDHTAGIYQGGLGRWSFMLPLIVLFLLTAFLSFAGRNYFSFLVLPILWWAVDISREIPRAREQVSRG